MLHEAIALRPRVVELVGIAHADQVRRDAAAEAREVGDDVPPQVRRRRVAVQQDDRVAAARLHVGHALPLDLGVALRIALESGHVRSGLETRQEHRVGSRGVFEPDRNDLGVGVARPPRLEVLHGGEADDDVLVRRLVAVRAFRGTAGEDPAAVGLDGLEDAALVGAKAVRVLDLEVCDEEGGHGCSVDDWRKRNMLSQAGRAVTRAVCGRRPRRVRRGRPRRAASARPRRRWRRW